MRVVVIIRTLFWLAFTVTQQVAAQSIIKHESVAEQYHQRALELAAAGDAGAGVWFQKAWEQDQADNVYIHDLTVYYIHQHRYSEALTMIRDCVKRQGPSELAWTLQGELLFEQKKYDAAYESLRNALDLSNANFRAHELIGLIFCVYRRYQLALEEMKIAAEQNPSSAQVRFYCGRLYYRTGNYADALEQLLACLKLQPAFPEALENVGLAYEAVGDTTTAIAQYRKAINLQTAGKTPASEIPYVCLGALLGKQNGDEEALPLLRQAVAKNPNSAWANFELGCVFFKAGNYALAEQHLKRSAQLDMKFSRPHFFLGRLYSRSNRQTEAEAEFRKFQELDSDPDNRQPQLIR